MEGVFVTELKHIETPKGDVFHAMKATDKGYCGFGEAYFSEVICGERKGWKRHNRMTLNLVVIKGSIRFILYDDRVGSKTHGEFEEWTLSPVGHYARLTVAPGVWMAFEGVADGRSLLLDIIPEPHDPEEADHKELGEIIYDGKL